MYDQLLLFLDKSSACFDYVQDGGRMEIWVRDKEWFPILISKVTCDYYRISWNGIVYRKVNTDEGLKFAIRLCQTIASNRTAR